MIYCDASFLVPLYLYEAGASERARAEARQWKEKPLVSPLAELEMANTLRRKILEKLIEGSDADFAWRRFREDLQNGIFEWAHLNLAVGFRDAITLTQKHTATGGHRSLDVLHVAMARLLGAAVFLSFDQRQNALAKAEKLKIMKLK